MFPSAYIHTYDATGPHGGREHSQTGGAETEGDAVCARRRCVVTGKEKTTSAHGEYFQVCMFVCLSSALCCFGGQGYREARVIR